MLVTSDQAIITNPDKMNLAGLAIMILSLIPLGMMHFIETKRFMVIRTDLQGITVRKFFGSKYYPWDRVIVETPKSEIYNVYIGLYCEDSDHGEVAAARMLINVRLSAGGKKEAMLLMSGEEASRFYRKLYYRNKISLDDAKQIRAFF